MQRCYSELHLADLYIIIEHLILYFPECNTLGDIVCLCAYVGVLSITVGIWAAEGCKDNTLGISTNTKLDIPCKSSWN